MKKKMIFLRKKTHQKSRICVFFLLSMYLFLFGLFDKTFTKEGECMC